MLVGCFAHEGNSFVPGATTLDDFRAATLLEGDGVSQNCLGPESELAGAWERLEAAGFEVVPTVAAWVGPRPPLATGIVAEIVSRLLKRVDEPIAGAYLMLHGASVAHDDDDPEGTVLATLRQRLGGQVPVVASLDLHANVTERMIKAVDGVAAYHTCPHVDTYETGAKAARVLIAAVNRQARPICSVVGRPMITSSEKHDSTREPFRCLMEQCKTIEASGAMSAAVFAVQPWLDVPGLGWKATVTTDGDAVRGDAWATELIEAAWLARREFMPSESLTVDQALEVAARGPAPFVVADTGDNTNGGTPGDSTELLRALLRREEVPRTLLSVCDPRAARVAYDAGAGGAVQLVLGTGGTGEYNERTKISARVERTYDGEYRHTHPVNRGYRAETGPAALVRLGSIDVVVHTRIALVIDTAIYETLGARPAEYEVVQAKAHVTFKAGFAALTPRYVLASTKGPAAADLEALPYKRRPRPLFPFEEGDFELNKVAAE